MVEDKPNYKFVKGDIADEPFIMDLFEKEKFDIVVNFAAEHRTVPSPTRAFSRADQRRGTD